MDLFKESFKRYKSSKNVKIDQTPTLTGVWDPDKILQNSSNFERVNYPNQDQVDNLIVDQKFCYSCYSLKPPSTWVVYKFNFPNGLYFIRNPFTAHGQKYWILKTLHDYPKPPHVTNIENLVRKSKLNDSKDADSSLKLNGTKNHEDKEFLEDLRWTTFGFHHDWDTKHYSEDNKCDFPYDLAELTKYIANVLGFLDFKAEAAIANYYHLDSTLSGHVDRSEDDLSAPLFSISFGQSAIFLIGGQTKGIEPLAVTLQSGDIVLMTGESRLSYHAVPKIFNTPEEPWTKDNDNDVEENDDTLARKKPKFENYKCCGDKLESCKIPSIEQYILDNWSNNLHQKYIKKSRINLNVRQVLFPNQEKLKSFPFPAPVQS